MHSLPETVDCNATSSVLEASKKILNLVFSFFFLCFLSAKILFFISMTKQRPHCKNCKEMYDLKATKIHTEIILLLERDRLDQIIIIQNMVPLFNEAPWNCCQSEEETRPPVSYTFIGTLTISILGTNCI